MTLDCVWGFASVLDIGPGFRKNKCRCTAHGSMAEECEGLRETDKTATRR